MSEEFNDLRKRAAKQQMQTDVMFDMLKAMTPQKKSSVPTDITVATAASTVPDINYRVPDGKGGWK